MYDSSVIKQLIEYYRGKGWILRAERLEEVHGVCTGLIKS